TPRRAGARATIARSVPAAYATPSAGRVNAAWGSAIRVSTGSNDARARNKSDGFHQQEDSHASRRSGRRADGPHLNAAPRRGTRRAAGPPAQGDGRVRDVPRRQGEVADRSADAAEGRDDRRPGGRPDQGRAVRLPPEAPRQL